MADDRLSDHLPNVRVAPKTRKKIEHLAEMRGTTPSGLIREAIHEKIAELESTSLKQ